jgi:hypothetical protein
MAPKTVYLHVGLHKTGTTYLQNVFRANRKQLRDEDVYFPGAKGEPGQALAVWDLMGRQPRGVSDRRVAGSWQSLVDHVNDSTLPTALVSEERLSLATLKQASTAVEAFADSEVHIIITARDLGRVAVSSWQEAIKNSQTWTWPQYAEAISDPARVATSPARGFWIRQDLEAICSTWEATVPPARLHLVTVPPSGASSDELLRRFASVVGFDPKAMIHEPRWNNETVGVAATEVIRRVNERLDGRLNQREHDKVMKMTVVPQLAKQSQRARFTLPDEQFSWATARADEWVAELGGRGYDVVGDLDELRPVRRPEGRSPEDATDQELLEAALDAMAALAEEFATTWWEGKKESVEGVQQAADTGSRTRRLVFRIQRKAADIADHNRVAAAVMAWVLKRRERARRRATNRRDG